VVQTNHYTLTPTTPPDITAYNEIFVTPPPPPPPLTKAVKVITVKIRTDIASTVTALAETSAGKCELC